MLTLTRAHWLALTEHLTQALPNEACGLLGGQAGQVQVVRPVVNRLRSPVAYEMDPVEQIETLVAFEAAGQDLVGIYHSHPSGPPRPSPTDVAQAYYPEAIYLICAPDEAGHWQGRAFRIEAGQVAEVPLAIGQ